MPGRAVVVGSGPNGLTGAAALAQAGFAVTVLEAAETVGGGLRSSALLRPGVVHDEGSAVHPLAALGPALSAVGADVDFVRAPLDAVHLLGDGTAAVLHTSVADTAAGLGADGALWRATFGPLAAHADALAADVLGPVAHVPRNLVWPTVFGAQALLPASWLWRRWRTPQARALFAGVAAHAFTPLDTAGSSAAGMMLLAAGHRVGWPVAVGGSQAIADALLARLRLLGAEIVTGERVRSRSDLAGADVVLLDTSIEDAAALLGDAVPAHIRRSWARFTHGPAVAKVDYVIEGDVPWRSEQARRAGTVHLGGSAEQIAAAEKQTWVGRIAERPFTLVAQQYLADPSRSAAVGGARWNPLWAYAHVPAGWSGSSHEVFELVTTQIEREAPGFRERIVDWTGSSPVALAARDLNNLGGEITGGANSLRQLIARPRMLHPYDTGVPGVYLCSASTPPGGGAHGMNGLRAAQRALRVQRARTR